MAEQAAQDSGTLDTLTDWFKTGVDFLGEVLVPAAALAIQFVPGAPPYAGTIIQKMPDIIASAEKMFSGDGKGEMKKEYFMQTAKLVAADAAGMSTGGQAETWQTVQANLDPLLSLMVNVVNRFRPGTIVDEKTPAAESGNNAVAPG